MDKYRRSNKNTDFYTQLIMLTDVSEVSAAVFNSSIS